MRLNKTKREEIYKLFGQLLTDWYISQRRIRGIRHNLHGSWPIQVKLYGERNAFRAKMKQLLRL